MIDHSMMLLHLPGGRRLEFCALEYHLSRTSPLLATEKDQLAHSQDRYIAYNSCGTQLFSFGGYMYRLNEKLISTLFFQWWLCSHSLENHYHGESVLQGKSGGGLTLTYLVLELLCLAQSGQSLDARNI